MMSNVFSEAASALGKVRDLVLSGDALKDDLQQIVDQTSGLATSAVRVETAATFAADRIKDETSALIRTLQQSASGASKEIEQASQDLAEAAKEMRGARNQFEAGVTVVKEAQAEINQARSETVKAKNEVVALREVIKQQVKTLVISVLLLFSVALGSVIWAYIKTSS
jgi:chromosome segregation ATPase